MKWAAVLYFALGVIYEEVMFLDLHFGDTLVALVRGFIGLLFIVCGAWHLAATPPSYYERKTGRDTERARNP